MQGSRASQWHCQNQNPGLLPTNPAPYQASPAASCKESKSQVLKGWARPINVASSRSLTLDFIINLKKILHQSQIINAIYRTASCSKSVHLKRKGEKNPYTIFKSRGIALNRWKSRPMSSRKKNHAFLKRKNEFCWNRVRVEQEESTSKSVNSFFLQIICQDPEEIPNNLSKAFFFFKVRGKCILYLFSAHVKLVLITSYTYSTKEVIIKWSSFTNFTLYRSYSISFNRIFPRGYSHGYRSSLTLVFPLTSCCSLKSTIVTCPDGLFRSMLYC